MLKANLRQAIQFDRARRNEPMPPEMYRVIFCSGNNAQLIESTAMTRVLYSVESQLAFEPYGGKVTDIEMQSNCDRLERYQVQTTTLADYFPEGIPPNLAELTPPDLWIGNETLQAELRYCWQCYLKLTSELVENCNDTIVPANLRCVRYVSALEWQLDALTLVKSVCTYA